MDNISQIIQMEQAKNKILGELESSKVELLDKNGSVIPQNSAPAVMQDASTITKDDIVNNLVDLHNKSSEILEHLQDIVMSELPESQKITETSSMVGQILNINKTLYDIKFKDEDKLNKDAKKQMNSAQIKEIIDMIKNNKS